LSKGSPSPQLKPLVTPLINNLIFLNIFTLNYIEMVTINMDTATLPVPLSTYPGKYCCKLPTMLFPNIGWDIKKLWVVESWICFMY